MKLIEYDKQVFKTERDILDYVTKGMVPSKKEFGKLLFDLREGRPEDHELGDAQVYLKGEVINISTGRLLFINLLERLYENRCWNRNVFTVGAAVVGFGAGFLLGGMRGKHRPVTEEEVVGYIADHREDFTFELVD